MISVLMPVYNAQDYIHDSISSILNQTYQDLEIIVCDDASNDNSYHLIQSFRDKRIKVVRNNVNIGYLRTINRLLSVAPGDFIAFQDADDISHPKRFEIQLDRIINEKFDLIGTNYIIIDQKGKPATDVITPPVDHEIIKRDLIKRNLFQKPSIIFKRSILEQIGGFRPGFLALKNISEDYDWLLRIDEAGLKMGNVTHNEPLYMYRSVPSAMTKGFNHIEQLFGERIAQYLALERRNGRRDSIDRNDIAGLKNLIEEWKKPYLYDSSLFFKDRAKHLMYSGLKKEAIEFAWKAVLRNPLSFDNIRTLQYCLRKTLIRI